MNPWYMTKGKGGMHKVQAVNKRFVQLGVAVLCGLLGLLATPLVQAEEGQQGVMDEAAMLSSIARGGRLYDSWYKELDQKPPQGAHTAYPSSGKAKAKDSWRCKECHGWDGMGKEGAYAKGKHFTGIVGITAAKGRDPQALVALLKEATHGYGDKLDDASLLDLAHFVSLGQVDMDAVIERKDKTIKQANRQQGANYYQTLCAQCHGKQGIQKGMAQMGDAASGNPWETLHKTRNGQPGEEMPALLALDPQIMLDIIDYMQTLPKKK